MNNQEVLNKLVGVHLCKAGDGTAVKPYVTPDNVDATLLVSVPRILNRTAYNIDEDKLPFVGTDAWNAYEFSTLLTNGFPVSGWLKFTYSSDSPNIVESKSVKLYLNSFNMFIGIIIVCGTTFSVFKNSTLKEGALKISNLIKSKIPGSQKYKYKYKY